jgi:hypothetical protein
LYKITQKEFVTLKVYDQSGKEVAILVDSEQEAGQHAISFNVTPLDNGIYFFSLTAEGNVQKRKMFICK